MPGDVQVWAIPSVLFHECKCLRCFVLHGWAKPYASGNEFKVPLLGLTCTGL